MTSEPEEGDGLYIAFTPYHAFLACGHALGRPRRSDLFLFADFAGAAELHDGIASWPSSPFSRLELFPGQVDRRARGRIARARWASSRIARRVRRSDYRAVHVFNDSRPEAQAALANTSEVAQRICLEDGTAYYLGAPIHHSSSRLARTARRLVFGPWWRELTTMATYPKVDRVEAAFPRLVKPEIRRGKPVSRLDPAPFTSPELRELAAIYSSALGLSADRATRLEVLVLPFHSGFPVDQAKYGEAIRGICRAACDHGLEVGIKLHPREPASDPFHLEGLSRVDFLPRGLGIEFLYPLLTDRFALVVGGLSTALLSARWLEPRARVACLDTLVLEIEPGVRSVFSALDIALLTDPRDLDSLLS